MPKAKRIKYIPDWFGCGRVITQKSWDGFLQAQKEYWAKKDSETKSENRKTP